MANFLTSKKPKSKQTKLNFTQQTCAFFKGSCSTAKTKKKEKRHNAA